MKSVIQTFRALEEVSLRQPVGVTELAIALQLPKSTVHRMLKTLESVGWVRQPGGHSSGWIMTAAPVILASRVALDTNLRAAARPEMEWLRRECGEAIHLAIRQGSEVVIIDQLEALHDVKIDWPIGKHSPLHTSANGKAIAAFSFGDQLTQLYPSSFEVFTEHTIDTPEKFDRELESVRQRGYATARSELQTDISSFAAPILDSRGVAIASISAFMPTYRAPESDETIGALVKEAVRRVEAHLSAETRETRSA